MCRDDRADTLCELTPPLPALPEEGVMLQPGDEESPDTLPRLTLGLLSSIRRPRLHAAREMNPARCGGETKVKRNGLRIGIGWRSRTGCAMS